MNNIYIIIFDKIHLHEQFFSSRELAENFLMEEGEKLEWWYLS